MNALLFTLRSEPEQRLDLSALTPGRLKGLGQKEIEKLPLNTTKTVAVVGDIFRIRKGDASEIHFIGGSERFDRIGEAMSGGSIVVEGSVGSRVGRQMRDGNLTVLGDAGPWAGSGMAGGNLTIKGNAGDWLAGPLAGELAGMSGGRLHVNGNAGKEAGHRLRRGSVVIDKGTGPYPGRSMIAGTLIVLGRAGLLPGYLMRRGTIVLGTDKADFSPTFLDSGRVELVFARLLAASLHDWAPAAAKLLKGPLRRLAGDNAISGKGEILIPA